MKTPGILLIIISTLFPSIIYSQGKPNFVGQWYEQQSRGKSKHRSEAFSPRPSDFSRTKRYNLKGNINQLNSIIAVTNVSSSPITFEGTWQIVVVGN